MDGKDILDERGVYTDPENEHDEPTVEGTAPTGGGITPGSDSGGDKRSPIESSPTIGHTIAGRSLGGEGSTAPGVGPGEEESGGGRRIDPEELPDQGHFDHE